MDAVRTYLNGGWICHIQLGNMSYSNFLQLSSIRRISAACYHLVAFGDQLPTPLQGRSKKCDGSTFACCNGNNALYEIKLQT